ncbi:MAG: hypothetical protein M0D57_20985 [Sphingobacteriales bacterium JAD_PAG50586_3]|nr:MAG: hypothetical protein M0D57_20985 [Sphingobacteriales bacterium JAD_PAG50586_3]
MPKIYYNSEGFSYANTPRQSVALPLPKINLPRPLGTPSVRGTILMMPMPVCQMLKFYFKLRGKTAHFYGAQKLKILLQPCDLPLPPPNLGGGVATIVGTGVVVIMQKLKILLQQMGLWPSEKLKVKNEKLGLLSSMLSDCKNLKFYYNPAALSGLNYF